LAALFAAAANTPLALSIMAVELFGAAVLPHVLIVCVVACDLAAARLNERANAPPRRLVGDDSGNRVEAGDEAVGFSASAPLRIDFPQLEQEGSPPPPSTLHSPP
jgi:hypothetical protein